MKLWRPMGQRELIKIESSGWRAFPPRLPEQPIFYPVLSFQYAEKIARDWNSVAADHDYLGFITTCDVQNEFIARYPVQSAGGKIYRELWIPAEDLSVFNRSIIGEIRLIAEYERGMRRDVVTA